MSLYDALKELNDAFRDFIRATQNLAKAKTEKKYDVKKDTSAAELEYKQAEAELNVKMAELKAELLKID